MTLTSGLLLHLAWTSKGCVSLAMMKTMEDELKVTLFLGRSGRLRDTTMGRMGRSSLASGRSLMTCWRRTRREQSSCNRHRRNCRDKERPDRSRD